MANPLRIGIDTGGTFTDFVVARGSHLTEFKLPSTPANPAHAILAGVARALAIDAQMRSRGRKSSGDRTAEIVHGTTVATNALLERKGARTALITTEGFEDVIEIGRQTRPELYNLMVTRPAPLVPQELRFGVGERIGPDGMVITPLDEEGLARIVGQIAGKAARSRYESARYSKVESVAVCLLFSFANPRHEQLIGAELQKLGVPVSLSHRILPEYREYERASTTVINAYLMPLMSRYLRSLAEGLQGLKSHQRAVGAMENRRAISRPARLSPSVKLRVMQSNGGSVSADTAAAEPVRAILSGPAGGVVAALRICSALSLRDIITFDMGGTSTDVALCRGEARTTNEALVAGLPLAVPILDIHTVGAGGGSMARVDEAGALRVGPESAGADPGPACYGSGERVTVTDANLILGRFGDASLLGGAIQLDADRAREFLAKLAVEMSRFTSRRVTAQQAALGVIQVANANMERALRAVSIERGQDPRLFTLVSFGGAGGLHVCELAAALRIPRVVIPSSPGTLSALGVLLGDVVKNYSRTVMWKTSSLDRRRLEREFAALERDAMRDLAREGFSKDRVKLSRSAAMRYVGQSFEIDVKWGPRFESAFHSAHRERYGYADAARPTEVVSAKVRAAGVTDKPQLPRARSSSRRKPKPARTAKVFLTERPTLIPIYTREQLSAGARLSGPAIITEYSSTTLVPAHRRATVDRWLNLMIE